MSNFYVYAHAKVTDGKTFYIGKGCSDRAWSFDGRSRQWMHMAVDHGRSVHILAEGLSEQAAFDLERQLIAMAPMQGLTLVNVRSGSNCKAPEKKKRKKNPTYNLSRYYLSDIRRSILSPSELAKKYRLSVPQILSIRRTK